MLRCATPVKTAALQAFRGRRCRGEDSNLCQVAGLFVPVGATQRGSSLASLYAVSTGLMLAATRGPWWVAVYVIVVGPAVGWHRTRRTA